MFQAFFGEDEHVASDGAYTRLLKSRKWLYVTGGVGVLLINGLYDEVKFKQIVEVISLPSWLLGQVFIFSLAYLLSQYVFLLLQLFSSYDHVLNLRFASKMSEQLSEIRGKIDNYESERQKIKFSRLEDDNVKYLRMKKSDLEESISSYEASHPYLKVNDFDSISISDHSEYFRMLGDLERIRTDLRIALVNTADVDAISSMKMIDGELDKLYTEYDSLSRNDLSRRFLYRNSEIAIDIVRIFPPCIFALLIGFKFTFF